MPTECAPTPDPTADAEFAAADAFVARWQAAGGSERANFQSFVADLCRVLGVPRPDPAREDTRDNAYVFERRATFRHGDGSESAGFIDCYRRACFVMEGKKVRAGAPSLFDSALQRARGQGESYARSLPAQETRPPFVVVVDVGNVIELYAEFSRSGATYTPFPDPRSHRIELAQLRDAAIRARLRTVWLEPLALDPSRIAGKVTRAIAAHLAGLARSLEESGHAPEQVAGFLTRCLFTLFAEDVGLLPTQNGLGAFTALLETCAASPAQFIPLVGELWRAMDRGEFSVAIRAELLRFNGKLFKSPDVLPLGREQIGALIEAGHADWTQVEPAIFGTLLERALDPVERHALGAHYTPRAYVERLVLPTVIEPLREQWANVQAAVLLLAAEGKLDAARAQLRAFHHRLCETRVLDPACGSGNFLYVSLEHMKRLEGEVLNQLESFGASLSLETAGLTVDPHQFLGLELNPRAAAIAELVLWIGYLQWHFRTRGSGRPPVPVLRDFRNIECRDAVLACERVEFVSDEQGRPLTRWDGRTLKRHPVTGEAVPDETARAVLERYVDPRPAQWPQADFVVGNPPFIGAANVRRALGDGYADALRRSWPEVPESADFVMHWWHHAAQLVRAGKLQRFGLITTNSLRQTFNRRVIERHLAPSPHPSHARGEGAADAGAAPPLSPRGRGAGGEGTVPLHIVFAIPDHPWVDNAGGAAVRIAMTVGVAGEAPGRLLTVRREVAGSDDAVAVQLDERSGRIHADLTVGADLNAALPLASNAQLAGRGFQLIGAGFIVTPSVAAGLGLGTLAGLERHIRPYRNGRDLTDRPRGVLVIDLFGLAADEVRQRYPAVFQWLLERVKPERDAKAHSKDGAAYARLWWLFGKPRQELRPALEGLPRYIATAETAKHRVFQFLDASIAPDNMLVCMALSDAFHLGVLSSRVHVCWALAAGGRLGVGNDPRYNKTRCFEPFPFPAATDAQQARIRELAEQLDVHRKRQLSQHPGLTLTGLYNVLEKLRRGETLSAKDKAIHEQGLVSVLRSLHDELDREVLAAYGWSDLAPLLDAAGGSACAQAGTGLYGMAAPQAASNKAAGDGQAGSAVPPSSQPGTLSNGEPQTVLREAARATLDATLLERLVALNAERAAEEAGGVVLWLRPEFQHAAEPSARTPQQTALSGMDALEASAGAAPGAAMPHDASARASWPAALPEQVAAVAGALARAGRPLSAQDIAALFAGRGSWKKRLPQLLETLVALGRARQVDGGRYAAVAT